MKVLNECMINFSYRLSPESPIINETILSNIVSTQLIKNRLEVKKYVNKRKSCYFDILTYKIVIRNVSSFIINNIFFQDIVPMNTRFINNSVTINGVKKRCIDPSHGFSLGYLISGAEMKITFKALVLPIPIGDNIQNCSSIEYDYIYNVEEPPLRVSNQSNIVSTKCQNKIFSQSSIGNILQTPHAVSKLLYDRYSITILETKVLNNYGKDLCTLLVIGRMDYELCYLSECNKRYTSGVFGFSECLAVPTGIIYSNRNDITATIEFASTNIIDKNTLFINATLLLHY